MGRIGGIVYIILERERAVIQYSTTAFACNLRESRAPSVYDEVVSFAPIHSALESFCLLTVKFYLAFKPRKIQSNPVNMNRDYELDTIEDNGMQKSPYHSEMEPVTKEERDAQVLARLGKKSVLEVQATNAINLRSVLIFNSDDLASSLS